MILRPPDVTLTPLWGRCLRMVANHRTRVVFAEGEDPRAIAAAMVLQGTTIEPVLVGDEARIREALDATGTSLSPTVYDARELALDPQISELLACALGDRAISSPEVHKNVVWLSIAAVQTGMFDGCVAGNRSPSGDVVRAALRLVGLRAGAARLTSTFLMLLPDGQSLSYADCAVIPEPDAADLALIAWRSANMHRVLTGERPTVAMLSFSTHGSSSHPSASRVRSAVALARRLHPELQIEGELQFDAAVDPAIAVNKTHGRSVAGRANVLVFPSLDAGNIAYKITQRLAGARAIGPILQGLRRPINDVSRGCEAGDLAAMALVTAVQATSELADGLSEATSGAEHGH